jgi:hypothetical protein
MQKKIILAISLLLLLSLGLFAYKRYTPKAPQGVDTSLYSQAPGAATISSSGIDGDPRASAAWAVLQAYITASKNHDVNTLKNLTYRLSAACQDPKQVDTCNSRMDKVVEITKDFNKNDFKNISYDNRQLVLSTDWHVEETDIALGEARKAVYFIIDKNGNPKVLYLTQPEEIIFSFKDSAQTKAVLVKRLEVRITDSDKDMLTDEAETCTFEGADPKTCIKTDPKKMDTDGNGWWDSFDQYLK